MRRVFGASLVCAIGLSGAVLGQQASGAAPRTSLASGRAPWAAVSARRGDADLSKSVSLRVYLTMRDRSGAAALASAVNNPTNAAYHRYLSADAFRARFAPTDAAVASVSSWLKSVGLQVGYVPANHYYVSATGTAGAAGRAFNVRLGVYAVRSLKLRSADSAPSVPASIAGVVRGVVGLDESARLVKPGGIRSDVAVSPNAPPSGGFRNARPCSNSWADHVATDLPTLPSVAGKLPWAPCGYKPVQLRSAYGLDGFVAKGVDGRGVTVGIVDAFASPTIQRDVAQYAARNDAGHPWKAGQYTEIIPPGIHEAPADNPCDPQGWYGEETLDVEAVHAMAPGANVIYSGGKSCEDPAIDAALVHLIDGNRVNMISNSYGNTGETAIPGDELAVFDQIATQAAIQGIGLYFSSGDNGDEYDNGNGNLPQPEVDFSANSPLVTAVGGTSTGIDATGKVVVEHGWETGLVPLADPPTAWDTSAISFLYGAGGGTSRVYREPTYQLGVVPDSLASRFGEHGRVVPDLAMNGDPNTGMLVGQTQTFVEGVSYGEYRIGGTSLSSPLFAGLMAIADQAAGERHGLLNPLLYSLPADAFRDVVPGTANAVVRRNFANGQNANDGFGAPTVRELDYTTSQIIHTAVGYDDVTGRGVPGGARFIRYLMRS